MNLRFPMNNHLLDIHVLPRFLSLPKDLFCGMIYPSIPFDTLPIIEYSLSSFSTKYFRRVHVVSIITDELCLR